MSSKFFKEVIRPEVREVQSRLGVTEPFAFQHWVADLWCEYNQEIEETENRILTSRDGGVDVMLFSPSRSHVDVIQTKYVGASASARSSLANRDDILAFAALREQISYEWVEKGNLSGDAQGAFEEYLAYMQKDDGHSTWHFVTTGEIPSVLEAGDVDCELYNTSRIKEIYGEAKSQDASIPQKVEFEIADESYIEMGIPRKTLVAVVKGNSIKNLYEEHKESLLAFNIRKYLGDLAINKNIVDTAQNAGEDFFYFNNGISAICNGFKREKNKITAEKMQIINGGQTIGSLYKAGRRGDISGVKVLLKLTVGGGLATEKGFNHEIIRCNNTQNAIKGSDFRANDKIQDDIKRKFSNIKSVAGTALKKKIDYRPKRGGKRTSYEFEALNLEKLARIRYAYKNNPCDAVEKPKTLWDVDKKYQETFGPENGEWSDEEFNEAVLALVFFSHITDQSNSLKKKHKERAKKSPDSNPNALDYLGRIKFHILGLARIYVETYDLSPDLWKNESDFEGHFKAFWDGQRFFTDRLKFEADKSNALRGGLSNLIRDPKRWEKLQKEYRLSLATKFEAV